ncbi:MAG: hypothetical protein BGO90_10920 [Legionella sp. 40-6]|nr:MAG: hypothetical protein BGO90_10920 [Legionella sp. 40-6]
MLLLMRVYGVLPCEKISQISAQIGLCLHVFMLFTILKIFTRISRDQHKTLFWLFLINIGLFLNDLAFYWVIYLPKNYTLDLSFSSFVIDIIPYSLWNVSVLIFLTTLIKNIFSLKNFTTIFSFLLLINLLIILIFFNSISAIFNYLSWQNISQITSSLIELIIYDLSIMCLIYSENKGLSLIVTGLIVLVSGDFIISYSFLAQSNSIATYGELFWLLGLLCVFLGMLEFQSQSWVIKKLFRSPNSIKGNLALWAFGISMVNILPFFGLAYLFAPLSKSVFIVLPPFFMLTSVLVVTLSLFAARHFEAPFKKIADNIESLMLDNDKNVFNKNFVIEEFIFLQDFILKVFDIKKEREKAKKALTLLTAQVAHDIRSPLAALNTCLNILSNISEKQRILMKNALNRINDIANNLLHQYADKDSAADFLDIQSWLLAPILESIISEKRLQYEGRPIELETIITSAGYMAFAQFDASRMKRLLSNLINNSAEAFSVIGGKITLTLEASDKYLTFKIIDDGCGIEADLLQRVFDEGISFKEKGFGLGLPDAKKNIEAFGGTIQLHSIPREGTTVEITLPRSEPPPWFAPEITVSFNTEIAILDDDNSVHCAWNQRLLAVSEHLTIHHFTTIQAFANW